MDATTQHGDAVGISDKLAEVMQAKAEHQGCGTSGGSGKASCGSSAGQGDLPTEIWEKVKNHPCYSARKRIITTRACMWRWRRRAISSATTATASTTAPMRLPPRRGVGEADARTGGEEGAGGGLDHPADDGAGDRGPWRPAGQPGEDLQDLRADLEDGAGHQAVPVDQRLGAAGPRRHHRGLQRRPCDDHHQHGGPGESGRRSIPWVFWKHKRYTGYDAAKLLTDRQMLGLEMLTERGILCKVNSVMIPGINDKHLVEVNKRGEVAGRVPAQHHAADLLAGAWHGVRAERPARPDGAGAESPAG